MNPDDDYKQIFFSNQFFFNEDRHSSIRIDLTNRTYLLIFILLIFTSQSITALPVSPSKSSFETNPFNLSLSSSSVVNYHHVQSLVSNRPPSTPIIPSYPNGMIVQIRNENQRQFKRERYRRSMIDRLFSQFDDDGLSLSLS